MTLIKLCSILLFLSGFSATAQDFRLGKVSKEELLQKVHPTDTSASAAYLFKRGKTYFRVNDRFFMVTEVECRIKIYKKEGYEYATQEMPYYTGGKTVKLNFSDAYTYNLVGGEIVKTKLKSDGEFNEEVSDNYSVKKITMPNVKAGSVIEFKYEITTPYFQVFPDWYFQYPIPANNIWYEVSLPNYFMYNTYLSGYIDIERTPLVSRTGQNSIPETMVTYSAKNVKALKDESYVNNIDNYLSILKHELASVSIPGRSVERFSTDWITVAKTIKDDEDFGKQLTVSKYFENDLNGLLTPGLTPLQKTEVIFNFVKERMNWNQKNGYYSHSGVKKAYEAKIGNAGDINLMLTAMLRYAKLDANPVLVSTRSNGVALFPSLTAYNYVICSVKINNDVILLDATSKNALPNVLPIRTLNWQGRLLHSNGSTSEVDLMPVKSSKEVINISASIDNEGKITGKLRDQYFDSYAYLFRENYGSVNKESYVENLEKKYNGIVINEYSVTNDKDLTKPLIESFDFEHNSVSDVIGNKIYISPMLFLTRTESPFKAEKREYPIDFVFPTQDKYIISITIPEGYQVESLPKALSIGMAENIGSFKYNIQATGNQIQLSAQYEMNYPHVSQEYYQIIKDFYQKMIEKQNEKIVLTKKL